MILGLMCVKILATCSADKVRLAGGGFGGSCFETSAVAGSRLSGGSGRRVCEAGRGLGVSASETEAQRPGETNRVASANRSVHIKAPRSPSHGSRCPRLQGASVQPRGDVWAPAAGSPVGSCCIYPWEFRNKQLRGFTVVLSSRWVWGWFLGESCICLFGKTLTGGYCYQAWANFHIFSIIRLFYECKRN